MIACQPTRATLEITNDSGQVVDFVYAEDFIDLRDFGRDYDALELGDIDTYQGCTRCDISPGQTFLLETPLARGHSVVLAARESETERLMYIRRYTIKDLQDAEWTISLVNQSN